MANGTGRISINLNAWLGVVNRVLTNVHEISMSTGVTVEADANDFGNLSDLIERVDEVQTAVDEYMEAVTQELDNMRAAGRIMHDQDQENQAAFSSMSGG